jgi:predicted DNA-binding transcriptional regulator YafY
LVTLLVTLTMLICMPKMKEKEEVKKQSSGERVYYGALRRVKCIHSKIGSGSFPGIAALAKELEVTPRTVKRDLDIMRNDLNAPIKYDREKRGFQYTDPGWALPLSRLTEGEMLAFFIAENALRFIGHKPEAQKLKQALAKIASQLPAEVSISLATLGESVSFQNRDFVQVDLQVLDKLALAAISQTTIEFDYYSPYNRQHSHRKADVHLLHNFAGDWYAVSFDHERQDFRDFHAARMSNLAKTGKGFELQKGWDADDYLARGFSMMRGGRMTTVVIHFDDYQAQWIRERNFFHPEEKREELPDGSLRLSFKIGENGLEAVARFCLQYAGRCRAEKPKKLRALVKEKLRKGLDLHR